MRVKLADFNIISIAQPFGLSGTGIALEPLVLHVVRAQVPVSTKFGFSSWCRQVRHMAVGHKVHLKKH